MEDILLNEKTPAIIAIHTKPIEHNATVIARWKHPFCQKYSRILGTSKFQSLPPKAESKISSLASKFILNIEHHHAHSTSCISI